MEQFYDEEEIIFSMLKKTFIFRHLNNEECAALISYSDILKYNHDEIIVAEGDMSPYLYNILSGTTSVNIKEKSGNEIYISTIGTGEVFGEAGMFLNVKRTANIIAQDEVVVLQTERKKFIQFIKKYPGAGIKTLMLIIYRLLCKLREADEELVFGRQDFCKQDNIDEIIMNFIRDDE